MNRRSFITKALAGIAVVPLLCYPDDGFWHGEIAEVYGIRDPSWRTPEELKAVHTYLLKKYGL